MSSRNSKDKQTPWRGDQRLRVELVFDGTDTRVDAVSVVEGPVVQRPSLTGNLVAVVSVDGEVQVLQAFEDPRLVRSIAPPDRIGHNYGVREEGRLIVDVPLWHDQPAHELEIKLVDLSDFQGRPLEPDQLTKFVHVRADKLQVMADIQTVDLARHPDWQEVTKTAAILPVATPEPGESLRAFRRSGYGDDDEEEHEGYVFQWWLHLPTQVVIAVRLDSADRVAGAARPLTDEELKGRAKGFQWKEEPRFTATIERHRRQFKRLGPRIRRTARNQRPEITDDFEALGFR